GVRRPRPAGDELPRARRDDNEPRRPPPAPAARGDPAVPGRAGVAREAWRAVRRRALPVPVADLGRARRDVLRRPAVQRRERARRAAEPRRAPNGRSAGAGAARDGRRRAAPGPALPAAFLRTGRRARTGARAPAPGRGDRALRRRRALTRRRDRRRGRRPAERHVGNLPRPRQPRALDRRRADRRRARAGARTRRRGGVEGLMEPWWISLIKALVVVNLVMVAFAYTTWLERKLLGRMQLRYGPNRAGPF